MSSPNTSLFVNTESSSRRWERPVSYTHLDVYKRQVLASLSVIASQIIFYKLINCIGTADNDLALYIVSVASGVGTFLALKVNTRFSKERTFVNVIFSDDKQAMMELRDFLKEHHITNLASDGYTKDWQKTIAVTAYTETKEQSRLIDEYLAPVSYTHLT